MKELLLTTLRNKETGVGPFRNAVDQLAHLLAWESTNFLPTASLSFQTPIAAATGVICKETPGLVVILRAGLALLPAFLSCYPTASVGFLGLARDERTFEPHLYYKKLPLFSPAQQVLILDPMIATAGSALLAIRLLLENHVPQSQIKLIGVVAAKQGIERIRNTYPQVMIHTAATDPELNNQAWIVPGLGDFGDRYFGTSNH